MNFDPSKFFIGLMDFFSILLPGALLAYLTMGWAGPAVLGAGVPSGAQGWAVFLFAAYLLGHLVFLVGSWLDPIYEWFRRRTLNRQIERVSSGRPLSCWLVRVVVHLSFKDERDVAVRVVERLRDEALAPLGPKRLINAFQWSKALLIQESPESMAVVQRFEADSKFFRSFVVVLAILLVSWLPPGRGPASGWLFIVALLLMLLASWRYMEQRHKATNQAYWSVITLKAREPRDAELAPGTEAAAPRLAGGVVFRDKDGCRECLFVEASDDPERWVLPKGHVEHGETDREAAIREVHEESGVWARVVEDLEPLRYRAGQRQVTVQMFRMEAIGRGRRSDAGRGHHWSTYPVPDGPDGRSRLHDETKEFLDHALGLKR